MIGGFARKSTMNTYLADPAETGVNGDHSEKPHRAIEPGVSAPSQVGSAIRIQGEIEGHQDMYVDGEVQGSMLLPDHTLTVGPKANVKANIKAQNVILVGNVEGKIEASQRIELRSRCTLLGDVRSPRILIENGAYIKGTVEVTR